MQAFGFVYNSIPLKIYNRCCFMSDLIVLLIFVFPMAFYIICVIKELDFQEEMNANCM